MIKRIIIILSLLAILRSCHYSCFNCTGSSYISCISCVNGFSFSVVSDPTTTPMAYWSSVYQTGTCVDTMGPKANPLGILLFIVLSVVCILIATKQSFYIFLTIQTFGLYNLVEIAWVNPIGYLLHSMEYLMIWNIVGSKYKSSDYTFTSNNYYRLSTYLYQTDIGPNIALIAAFTILSMVLLIIICLVAVKRKKQKQIEQNRQKEQVIFQNLSSQEIKNRQKQNNPTCMEKFSETILIQIAKFLLSVLFLMAQQTSLVFLVSLVFKVNTTVIILSIIYLHILVFTMSYAYYYRVQYFKEKNVMYINFAKKVVLPIMVVIPLKYQHLFFVFAGVIILVELIIDCYNGLYKKLNRLAFYKGVQIFIVVLLIVYYITQRSGNSYPSSKAASLACTFAICFYLFLFVGVELPIGIKARFFSKNQNKVEQLQDCTLNYMLQDVGQKQFKQTLQIISMNSQSDSQRKDDNNENGKNDFPPSHPPEDKITKDDNQSIKQSVVDNKPQQIPKPEPAKKKRRKQILDKELRMRYGI